MSDSPLTKEKADRIKLIKAELAALEAETSKPRESKQERHHREAMEKIKKHSNGELALCKQIGKETRVELKSAKLLAAAAKLQADGLVMLYGDEHGAMWAKAKTHYYGVTMGDLK